MGYSMTNSLSIANLIAFSHLMSESSLAQVFIDFTYKLHGFPSYIVSDRDTVLTSTFCRELMNMLGIQQLLSSTYHPQTDEQTERVNQYLENCLRCMCGQLPKKWSQWIALAKLWYNNTYHSAIDQSPFEALYEHTPPQMGYGTHSVNKTIGVEEWFKEHQLVTQQLKKLLKEAQKMIKQIANAHKAGRNFNMADWVHLKLKP